MDSFKQKIEKHQLFSASDQLLVGVSGGRDSMVLLHLLDSCDYKITVAHVNYQLRGKDSNDDESLVHEVCQKMNVPLFSKKVNIIENSGDSLQMQARALRYSFFDQCCDDNGLNKIVLAHHSGDLAETLTLQFIKGPTLFGMTGIPNKRDRIVRPLLEFTSDDLQQYCEMHKIPFRLDRSNESNAYQRNFIRHEVIPKMEEINPSLINSLNQGRTFFIQDQELMIEYVDHIRDQFCERSDEALIISKECLKKLSAPALLFYLLRPFDYSRVQCAKIIESIAHSGAIFHSDPFTLQVRKDDLIVSKAQQKKRVSLIIDRNTKHIQLENIQMNFQLTDDLQINKNPEILQLDHSKLKFPLVIRNWKEGDSFQPLGMNGQSKKISDLLNDHKLSAQKKQRVLLLIDGTNEVAAVVGLAQSDRFKVSESTAEVLLIQTKKAVP